MKKCLFISMIVLLAVGSAGCGSDSDELSAPETGIDIKTDSTKTDSIIGWLSETDIKSASDPNSIVGVWEFKAFVYPYPYRICEVPEDERDLFVFNSLGQVKVIKKTKTYFPAFPNENGEYDYSYNKERQRMQFYGKKRQCILSEGEMHIEGYWSAYDGYEIAEFVFIKKQN